MSWQAELLLLIESIICLLVLMGLSQLVQNNDKEEVTKWNN